MIEGYHALFVHRGDRYAVQQPNGAYLPVLAPFTVEEVAEHLAGIASYGLYTTNPEGSTVHYVVFDTDNGDADLEHLCQCVESLVLSTAQGELDALQSLLLESSGRKGYHVWLFLSEPLPAAQVRSWLEASFWPAWGDRPRCEVFPKQDTVTVDSPGNLIKLPLGVHAVSGKKSEILGRIGWADGVLKVQPFNAGLVPQTSSLPTRQTSYSSRPSSDLARATAPLACIDMVMHDGVGEGHRDQAMYSLALYLFRAGIDQDFAEQICLRANENFRPSLPESEVRRKVQSAYRGRFRGQSCSALRDICPGPCFGGRRQTSPYQTEILAPGQHMQVEIVEVSNQGSTQRVKVKHERSANTPTLVLEA